ncbi:MAG: hemolysin family protein [Oscillospiraceae bacterium]|nr:hemolysin family protein [Oscillospiraceae bacterium]
MYSPGTLYSFAVILLLILSALAAMAETSVSSVGKLRLKMLADKGSRGAKTALALVERYDKTLSTILVCNNVVNIAAASLATLAFTAILGDSGVVAATAVITVLVIIFGEILPKSYARDHSEKVILSFAGPLKAVCALFSPVTFLLMKLRGAVSPAVQAGPTVTEEDLLYLIDTVEEEGVIEEQERDLVQSALEFDEIDIKDILTPRVNMAALDADAPPQEIREMILSEGYSRIPVYEESIDSIIGILFAKDYLRILLEGGEPDLRSMLAKPNFVHRSMKISDLLALLKKKRQNMAIVTDDYGGTLGLITTQDIIEEIVGGLWEDDEETPDAFVKLGDGIFEILGSCPLRDLEEQEDWQGFDFEGDYSTVNGWAMQFFGHIPAAGESAEYRDLILEVLQMDGNRIDILKVTRKSA